MTYAEYKAMMAYYGFVTCPLTEAQFVRAKGLSLTVDDLYGLGCDVNAGVPFTRALGAAIGRAGLAA